MSQLRQRIRPVSTWYRRNIWRGHQPRGYIEPLRAGAAQLGSFYTAFLIFCTVFNGFWIVAVFLMQLSDIKKKIEIFPEGFNDGVTIIALAFLALAAAFTGSQASVKNEVLKGLYGYAGRAFLHGFLFLAMSFTLALGHRIISEDSFKSIPGSAVWAEFVTITPFFMLVNAGVAGCFFAGGLFAFVRILSKHD